MDIDSISLIDGWLFATIFVLAALGLLLTLRWDRRTLVRQLAIGVPLALTLVGIAALLVDGLDLIPYQFPNSYYLYIGLVFLTMVMAVVGWPHARNWWRVVAALAVVFTSLAAATLINKEYAYYPNVGALLGKEGANEMSLDGLQALRHRSATSGSMPANGVTVSVDIAGTQSGFKARKAIVWVPPKWIADASTQLPVLMLLIGSPGNPDDWTRAGFADQTANAFAAEHGGIAPLIVMPDPTGSVGGDSQCVDSATVGHTETYLTVDVPAYMRANFGASSGDQSLAVAGFSAGGTCALVLAVAHPDLFTAFGSYSGLASPTLGEDTDPARTIEQLFGGSQAAYDVWDPVKLLAANRYPNLAGWFEVGADDPMFVAAQQQIVPLAKAAGIQVCHYVEPNGGHSFEVWADAFRSSLPWLSGHLGVTPAPTSNDPAQCSG